MSTTEIDAPVIVYRKTRSLKPYKRNTRRHSRAQVLQIADSIKEFGWAQPLLIRSSGQIIAGHGRWMAAKHLEEDTVPCIVADDWTEAQVRAYGIADNRIALGSEWDPDLLGSELQELNTGGFDVGLLGMSEGELAGYLEDDVSDPEPETEKKRKKHVVVGIFKQELDPDVLEDWVAEIQEKHDGDMDALRADVLGRLGFED